jgi:methyl-accepting chemotaxis protein
VQECAAQIGDITLAVKDLASQSNVLSINAAIEAARSGEHGSGFAVVAQEFRKLTDQSLRETVRIGNILEQVRGAVRELVTMSEQGSKQVEGGLEMVKASGESLRELSGIIQENAAAARMIASAVAQQDTGISQVFTAITQLAKGMDEAMQRMETTLEASRSIDAITQQVQEIARSNQVAG